MNTKRAFSKPRHVSHFTFLVDSDTPDSSWGITWDMEKITRNLKLLVNHFKIRRGLAKAVTTYGVTRLIRLGRFITIIKVKKDDTDVHMTFIDFTSTSNYYERE